MKERNAAAVDFDRALGQKIKECRISFGYSQEQVVAQLQLAGVDMCREIYSRLERGLRPLYPLELLLLSGILNIDLSVLAIPGRFRPAPA